MKTQEQNPDGSMVTITADFRKYPCIEDSIADYSVYLLGAKNGSNLLFRKYYLGGIINMTYRCRVWLAMICTERERL